MQPFRSLWLHGHPVLGGGVWMLGSQRRLRGAEVVSLYWGHWWGLFRGFLLAFLSMALSSYKVCFCPGCSLRFSLNLWAPRGKASCGVSVYLSDRTHVNTTMALVSMATSLARQALTYLCSKDFSNRPILLPPQSIPSAICSLAGLPRALGTQARAPSTFSGMDKPPVLWAFRVWGTYLTAHVLYQTFPHLIMFIVGSSNPFPTHDFFSYGR